MVIAVGVGLGYNEEIPVGYTGNFMAASVPGVVTFTRASTGRYFGSDGLLKSASTDVPRFDYDPATLQLRGLLREGARTNLLLWNRDLTNAAWTATDATVAKTATGIDGVSNSASVITATAGNATVLQTVTSGSAARAGSAYIRRVTGTGVIQMTVNGGTNWETVTPTATWTRVAPTIRTVTNPQVGFRVVTSGDVIEVDFVQLESAQFPSSPIETTTATVTRAKDSIVVSDPAAIGYSSTAGTLIVEHELMARANSSTTAMRLAQFYTNSNNRFNLTITTASNLDAAFIESAATRAGAFTYQPVVAANQVLRAGIRWSSGGSYGLVGSGLDIGTPATTNAGAFPAITTLVFGDNGYDSSNSYFGWLRSFDYMPRHLSDGEFRSRTLKSYPSIYSDIIVIIGQSNADGRGTASAISGTLQTFYTNPTYNLFCYYKNSVRTGGGVTSGSLADDGTWFMLDDGHSNANAGMLTHQVVGDEGSSVPSQSSTKCGLELELAYQYAQDFPTGELRIIKAGVGGSGIQSDWDVTSAASDKLWYWFLNYHYLPAVADIVAVGRIPRIIGVFWMQGETDASAAMAQATYEGYLQTLVNRLNSELGYPVQKIVIGGLGNGFYNSTDGNRIKAAQAAVAAANDNTEFMATDGSDSQPAIPLQGDNIHYTTDGLASMAVKLWGILNP